MIVVCGRTCREVEVPNAEAARRTAEDLGFKDYHVKPAPRRPETNIGE